MIRFEKGTHEGLTKLRNICLAHKGTFFQLLDEEGARIYIKREMSSPLSLAEADTGPVRVGRRMRDMQCSEADRAAKY